MLRTAHSLVRITAFAAMLTVVVAIGLARLSPGPEARTSGPGSLIGVATRYPAQDARLLQLIDVRDGTIRSVELGRSERIDLAIGSHWVDGWDQAHVVGRWNAFDSTGTLCDAGLARVAFPSGRVIDRVPMEHYPITPPCWVAGTSARVLFVSGDGNLYRYDFEAEPRSSVASGLSEVRWAVKPPGDRGAMLIDVVRPDGILSPDLVLVTLMPRDRSEEQPVAELTQIWWLRLGPDEREIIGCGPVTVADPDRRDVGRRRPTLGRRPDGALWLAYLSWNELPNQMFLRVAPARIDERTGAPAVDSPVGMILADSCMAAAPAFTAGGTRLTYQVATPTNAPPSALQIVLDDAPSPTALAVAGLPPGL